MKLERNEITKELVREWFDYKDGKLYWKKDKATNAKRGDLAGHLKKQENRYVLMFMERDYFVSRMIFFWHHGYFPEIVDHIDRDTTNDKIENLRAASRAENQWNVVSKPGSTSQYLGVSLCITTSVIFSKRFNENRIYKRYGWRAKINYKK